jgi:hypothetical protein
MSKKGTQNYLEKKRRIRDAAKSVPCMDCGGVFDPCQMDFDHRDSKVKEIGTHLSNMSLSALLLEIEKCDVVCANCHRLRTKNRAGL